MKTSLSAALFLLPETTNSTEGEKIKGDEEGKSECSPGAPFTSCADEKIGEKGLLKIFSLSPLSLFSLPRHLVCDSVRECETAFIYFLLSSPHVSGYLLG